MLAVSFHTSALYAVLIYFFINRKTAGLQQFRDLIFLLIVVLFQPLVKAVLTFIISYTRYSMYFGVLAGEGSRLLIVYFVVMAYICIVYQHSNQTEDTRFTMLYGFCVLTCLTQSFALSYSLANRLSEYFSMPMFLLLPNTIDRFNAKSKKLAGGILIAVSFGWFLFGALTENSVGNVFDYNFFFSPR